MSNSKIQFSKSFTREIKINGATFKIIQNLNGYLSVFDEYDCIYHYDATTNEVSYHDDLFAEIKRVLHQAHIDRYAVKSTHV
jgi:hypothetical protein